MLHYQNKSLLINQSTWKLSWHLRNFPLNGSNGMAFGFVGSEIDAFVENIGDGTILGVR
jgi:hypothetical protein